MGGEIGGNHRLGFVGAEDLTVSGAVMIELQIKCFLFCTSTRRAGDLLSDHTVGLIRGIECESLC